MSKLIDHDDHEVDKDATIVQSLKVCRELVESKMKIL